MPEIISPGDAFSTGLQGFLTDRETARQNAIKNQLAIQREQRMNEEMLLNNRLKTDELLSKQRERERQDVVDEVGGMVKGDIPPPELITRAKKFHVPLITAPGETVATIPEGRPQVQLPGASAPVQMPGAQPPQPVQGAPQYAGSTKERLEARHRQDIEDYVKSLPADVAKLPEGDPRRLQIEFRAKELTGQYLPAGFWKSSASESSEGVFRVSPNKKQIERMVDGQWKPWTGGDVPKGSHWLNEPQPPQPIAINVGTPDQPVIRIVPKKVGASYQGQSKIDPSKLTNAQQSYYTTELKRRETQMNSWWTFFTGQSLSDEEKQQKMQEVAQEVFEDAKKIGPEGKAAEGKVSAADKLRNR